MRKKRAFKQFCREVFNTSNLIGTDFEDVSVLKVERPFVQDERGLHVQFTVSLACHRENGQGCARCP